MKYIVDVNGSEVIVELDAEGVRVDGERVRAHLADVEGTPVRLVTVGSEVHRAIARRGGTRGRYTIWLDGYRYEVEFEEQPQKEICVPLDKGNGTECQSLAYGAPERTVTRRSVVSVVDATAGGGGAANSASDLPWLRSVIE